jgi:probable O-glycosylation ligase (exosortase A-associated)
MPVYFIVFIATVLGTYFSAKDREPFPWTRETKLFALLLAWYTLTTFWDPDFPYAAREKWSLVMKIYMGIFPTFLLINSRERLRWLVMTIALSFGLIGLKGGIFAAGTGFHYRVWGPEGTFYGGNNEIALALNISLPLIMLCARETENRNAKLFFYTVFGFSICSIISSWSRGGLLTLCAVLGAMVLCGRRKWISVPLIFMAIMFALPNLPQEWFTRMETIKTYEDDQSAQSRFIAWHYAIDKAVEHPLTGGGFETFQDAWVDAHSGYFKILGEHGFFALALWLSLLFGTMIALERLRLQVILYDSVAWIKEYARAFQISLLGYAVGGCFLNVAYWDIFYHLVALTVVLKVMLGKVARASEEEWITGKAERFRKVPAKPALERA